MRSALQRSTERSRRSQRFAIVVLQGLLLIFHSCDVTNCIFAYIPIFTLKFKIYARFEVENKHK
jgi:hypothetical protein